MSWEETKVIVGSLLGGAIAGALGTALLIAVLRALGVFRRLPGRR